MRFSNVQIWICNYFQPHFSIFQSSIMLTDPSEAVHQMHSTKFHKYYITVRINIQNTKVSQRVYGKKIAKHFTCVHFLNIYKDSQNPFYLVVFQFWLFKNLGIDAFSLRTHEIEHFNYKRNYIRIFGTDNSSDNDKQYAFVVGLCLAISWDPA